MPAADKLPKGFAIREASMADLEAIYPVAQEALFLDRFTRELLAEKLFANRRPDEFRWSVQVAEHSSRIVGFMQSAFRVAPVESSRALGAAPPKGWVGLYGVESAYCRHGVARALHDRVLSGLPRDVLEIEPLAIPCNYLVPGIDPRYTESLCLLEALGYERFGETANLTVDLTRPYETADALRSLAARGVEIRRAQLSDSALLDGFFDAHFGDGWRYEAELALRNDPPSLHVAFRDGRIIAFSAHSTQNRELGFFGPMGTAPDSRGLGLGRVLLWLCLNDLREAGHRTAVIPWVGPITFYHRWAGCRVERIFWRYRLIRGAQTS
jgi:GNAT superfamily N-acetyltransferase